MRAPRGQRALPRRAIHLGPAALRLCVVGAALAALVVVSPSQGAPSNDAFAAAKQITATSGVVTGTTDGATVESGEPPLATTLQNTTWYRFQTKIARTVVFDISASKPSIDSSEYALGTAIADVFTGSSLDSLTKVGSIGLVMFVTTGRQSIEVNVPARMYVYIRVASDHVGPSRDIALQWGPPPSNDRFVLGAALSGASGSVAGSTLGATTQTDEPPLDHDPGVSTSGASSVWYRWTAPETGTAVFQSTGTYRQDVAAFAAPSTLANLLLVAKSSRIDRPRVVGGDLRTANVDYPLAFGVRAGQSFILRVAPRGTARGRFTLAWSIGAPPNDRLETNFAPLRIGSSSSLSIATSNLGATPDPGEGDIHPGVTGGSSIWFGLYVGEPPGTRVTLTTNGSEIDTVLAVYAWSSAGVRTRVASDDDSAGRGFSRVSFDLDAEAIWVAVDGKDGAQGRIKLKGLYEPPNARPPNDAFQKAITLSGLTGRVEGTFLGATRESRDPRTTRSTQTVWYRWTAPATGRLQIAAYARCSNVWSGCPAASVQLFRGSTLAGLVPVATPAGSRPEVSAGTPYSILVTPGPTDTWRDFRVSWYLPDD